MFLDVNSYLSRLQEMTLEQILGGADTSLTALRGTALITLIVLMVCSALWCFLGLKLVRVWSAILGFVLGFSLGAIVAAAVFHLDQNIVLIIGAVAGIVLACLGAILYRLAVFLVAWLAGTSVALTLLNPSTIPFALVCLGIGFVVALFTVAFAEPVVILATGVYGAMTLGTTVSLFLPMKDSWVQIAAIVVFAILGIWFQFVLESGRRKRNNLKKAREIREKNSTANEVEKARAVMDNLDDIPAAEEAGNLDPEYEEFEEEQFEEEYDIDEDDDITYIQ